MPAYLFDMSHLNETHPEAFEYLKSGGFSAQIGDQNTFGRIPIDQACEETVNKDTLKKSKLQTFSELNKKVKIKTKTAKEIILQADRALFGQMIIIAGSSK